MSLVTFKMINNKTLKYALIVRNDPTELNTLRSSGR